MTNVDETERARQLHHVDWSTLPQPEDDGGADHLRGSRVPSLDLTSSKGAMVNLAALSDLTVVFAYPRTGRPDQALPQGWDMIPGARGCTPQACAFRDIHDDLRQAGAQHVFGLSTQNSAYQKEAAERLHLPFPLLSDSELEFTAGLNLPTMQVEDWTLIRRITLIIRNGIIEKTFYPVFPPDESADMVLNWLNERSNHAQTDDAP